MEVGIGISIQFESTLSFCTRSAEISKIDSHIFWQKFREINSFSIKMHYLMFFFQSESKLLVFPHCGTVVLYEVLIFTWNLIKVRWMMVINESSRAFMTFARCGRLCSRNSTFNLSKYHMWAKITIILIYFSTAGSYNVAKKGGKRIFFFKTKSNKAISRKKKLGMKRKLDPINFIGHKSIAKVNIAL